MTSWLLQVKQALDESPQPITFFFRDDDGGWEDSKLFSLMSLCSDYGMPVDIAVIPNEITPSLKRGLDKFLAASHKLFGVHQHGFAHANHQSEGRKCEFGISRNFDQQMHDIEQGKERLKEAFGESIDPIFTPPWNRCTETTAKCLIELGFKLLSCDETAVPFRLGELKEIPINIDWFAKKKGLPLGKNEIGKNIADKIGDGGRVGVMFHHALIDEKEISHVEDFFKLLAGHRNVKVEKMSWLETEKLEAISKGV